MGKFVSFLAAHGLADFAMPFTEQSDSLTTVAELKRWVDDFVAQRDWHQFHAPKNLAMSMAIEAAELMEHFQWLSVEESRAVADDPKRLAEVGEELADVLCYALAMANELHLDLATTIRKKIAKNEQKYPADEYRGRYGPDDTTNAPREEPS
jgi:NTP pyrophosphatase (non-canonical NTP hydrolase)